MGNYTSKFFSNHGDNVGKSKVQNTLTDEKLITSELCTPVQSKKLMIDPRSASSGIARTPIELSSTPVVPRYIASAIPKHLQTKKYLETDFDNVMSTSPVTKCIPDPRSPNTDYQRTPIMEKHVTNYVSPIVTVKEGPNNLTPDGKAMDPRSPTTNFDRTPIIKPKTSEHPSTDLYETSIIMKNQDSSNIVMSYCETKNNMNITEVQALPEIIVKQPVNLVDRLNDSDAVNTTEHGDNSFGSCYSDDSVSEEQITVIPNLKSTQFNKNPLMDNTIDEVLFENELEEEIPVEKNKKEIKIAKEIKGRICVWRDSTSPQPVAIIPSETVKKTQEIIIEFDDEDVDGSVITSSKPDIKKWSIKIDDNHKTQVENHQVDKAPKTKSLRKEIKMILDDLKDINEAPKSRTPLSNRSNHHKAVELGKSPHQFLRNKALSIQQENTPPTAKRFRGKNTVNGATWDPDMSVII